MTTGVHKVVVNPKAGRSLSRGLSVAKASEHTSVGAAVIASGRAYASIVVLPGTEAKYRELADGEVETPADDLPQGAKVFDSDPAGVDSAIMLSWVSSYLEEKADLPRSGQTLFVYDGYASPLWLHVLTRLVENNVLVHALPSHCSHDTKPLYVAIFGPMNGATKIRVSSCGKNSANAGAKFTIFTACELVASAYTAALTPANIKSGFQRTGMFPVSFSVFNDVRFSISSPYATEGVAEVSDPWEDVHCPFFLAGGVARQQRHWHQDGPCQHLFGVPRDERCGDGGGAGSGCQACGGRQEQEPRGGRRGTAQNCQSLCDGCRRGQADRQSRSDRRSSRKAGGGADAAEGRAGGGGPQAGGC